MTASWIAFTFVYSDMPKLRRISSCRWQHLGTFRNPAWPGYPDKYAQESFVYHTAGAAGMGDSSYVDDVILRDADESTMDGGLLLDNWASTADDSPGDRLFYLQNWRADVVVTVREAASTGDAPALVDHVRYSSYGVPWGTSLADMGAIGQTAYAFAPDGQITVDDSSLFSNAYNDNDLLADVTGIGRLTFS